MDHNASHSFETAVAIIDDCSLNNVHLAELTMKLVSLSSSNTFRHSCDELPSPKVFSSRSPVVIHHTHSVHYKLIPFFKKSHFRNQYHAATQKTESDPLIILNYPRYPIILAMFRPVK